MQLDEDLNAIKRKVGGCTLAAFGDLRTQLILRVVSDHRRSQESLDQMCAQAKRAFKTADALAKSQAATTAPSDHAIILTSNECHLFVRAPRNHSDVLMFACKDFSATEHLVSAARQMLQETALAS
ncbi:hypothetical protein [Marivita hallyeonensis]|uniref:Roadblock/LAMTOR2 domain-containing protein n=1 Tax=Marivita hallyeonensis TaxID=996342 RepID=A0A1M5RYC2_9RHOB|nr:hypothetical protein [Marivita hallyeonensis]SHH31235.1 hypothetical protein SAMN05443551_1936 [Marivita hallyeonensis]